jgi:hypothetical protein
MDLELRRAIIAAHRPRGVYVPTAEASLYLAGGWSLLDDCPAAPGAPQRDEVLLLPPACEREGAA